jgi:hypothetical protein
MREDTGGRRCAKLACQPRHGLQHDEDQPPACRHCVEFLLDKVELYALRRAVIACMPGPVTDNLVSLMKLLEAVFDERR